MARYYAIPYNLSDPLPCGFDSKDDCARAVAIHNGDYLILRGEVEGSISVFDFLKNSVDEFTQDDITLATIDAITKNAINDPANSLKKDNDSD